MKQGDVIRLEIARISERYQFAIDIGDKTKPRLVLILNTCDVSMELFVNKDEYLNVNLQQESEYNIVTVNIGSELTAKHAKNGYFISDFKVVYLVPDDDDKNSGKQADIRKFKIPCPPSYYEELELERKVLDGKEADGEL